MALGEVDRTGSPIVVLLEVTEAGMGKKLPVSWAVNWQGMFDGKGPPGNQDDFGVTGTKERQQVERREKEGKELLVHRHRVARAQRAGLGKVKGQSFLRV